jgi:predicted AAA+ superfamily ATPase
MSESDLLPLLTRIAEALERIAPPKRPPVDFAAADAFVWHADPDRLDPVPVVNRIDIQLLQGIERQRDILLANTRHFAAGLPANNALLWGARGTGKSSIVKAVHATVAAESQGALALVEIHREDIPTLPRLLALLKTSERRFILFCDDLSFDAGDEHYKSLKGVLEGGVEGRPDNVVFYATSNRRHLMPEFMHENLETRHVGGEIHPGETTEEKISLSERFGLWLSFYPFDQDQYLDIATHWVTTLGGKADDAMRSAALLWALERGSRSGRVAWQFAKDHVGRQATARGRK